MRHPIQILKTIGFLLLLVLFFLSVSMSVQAADKIILKNMQKVENPDFTRITFTLSALPKFASDHSGQRADLLLSDVELDPALHQLPEDERVVKMLLAQKRQDLLISILLRRPPVQIVTESKKNPTRIVMDIYWKSGDDTTRPSVAFRITDMPPRKAGRRAARYQQESPWKDHWNEFIRNYRTYWKLDLPVTFTLPTLPPLISDKESPLWPLQEHANNNMFLSLIQKAAALKGLTPQQTYLRDILASEAQLRTGAKEAAIARLDSLLRKDEGTEKTRVEYLTAYGQALEGQPMVAQLTLLQLLQNLSADDPFFPLIHFLFAETALATGQNKVALEHLQAKDVTWPASLMIPVDLRTADAKAGLGKLDEAVAAYRDLAEEPGLFDFYRFSYNRAGFSAFKNKNYKFSSEIYRKMVDPLVEGPGDDLILFAAGAAAYEAGDMGWGMIGLQRAVLDRPETEGGDRAELRLIDIRLLKGGELALAKSSQEYAALGQRSQFRPVREEGRFKHALTLYLLGDHRESIDKLMQFRREFSSSELVREVDLLILQQLPTVVHQLIEEKNDLQAVVLAEKNRKLLLRNGFDKAFLRDLATAFDRLGLYERAGRVLLYLFDRTGDSPDHQYIYLPLAQSYLKRGEYQLASSYAERYLKKYPQGEDAGALFSIMLDAFERQGQNDKLVTWLNRTDRPSSRDLEVRAAYVYWRLGNMLEVVRCLERAQQDGGKLEVKEMALLAEAYYQIGRNSAAEKIYRQLHTDPDYGVRARYRTAQILLRLQKRRSAISLLKEIVASDVSTRWGKLAQDLLIQEQR